MHGQGNVLYRRSVGQKIVALENNTRFLHGIIPVDFFKAHIPAEYITACWYIQPGNQGKEGGFSRSRLAYNGVDNSSSKAALMPLKYIFLRSLILIGNVVQR